MLLNIGICEDEFLQRELLINYLNKIFKSLDFDLNIHEFSSGEEILGNYPSKIDILFLDIQMDKLTGMDTARKIREFDNNVEIVFTTAILDYIHEGYEVRAYRYLLKPLKYEDISKHIKSCIDDILQKKNTIAIKSKEDTIVIDTNKILYIEVLGKELTIYTEEENHTVKMSMKNIEKNLLKANFFRCHKSYLINLKKVKSFKENLVIIKDMDIPVSRYRVKDLKVSLAHVLGDILC